MFAAVGQKGEKVWMNSVDEDWIETLQFPAYYPKTGHLGKYDQLTLFLNAVLTPHDHRPDEVVSKTVVPYLHNLVWKASSVKEMCQPGIYKEDDAIKWL